MKSLLRLLALGAVVSSLASCGRSTYSFNSQVPSGLSAAAYKQQLPRHVGTDSAASIVLVGTPAPGTTPAPAQPGKVVGAATAARPKGTLPAATAIAQVTTAEAKAPARPVHMSLVQKLVLKRMATQLHKVQAARQNGAHVEKAQAFSRVGRAALIALIGAVLVAIVIGASANSVETATGLILLGIIGYALLVTGIVLLVITLVNGG